MVYGDIAIEGVVVDAKGVAGFDKGFHEEGFVVAPVFEVDKAIKHACFVESKLIDGAAKCKGIVDKEADMFYAIYIVLSIHSIVSFYAYSYLSPGCDFFL